MNYLVKQECPSLQIGNAARPSEDLRKLQDKGVMVFAVQDDLEARGINREECFKGVQMIQGSDIAGLFENYEQIWHW